MSTVSNPSKPNFEILANARVKRELKDNYLKAITRWFLSLFVSVPRVEIFHNLKELTSVADRYRSLMEDSGTAEQQDAYVSILAYLKLAAIEKNFAKAWSYINLADVHLPLIVKEHELKSVIQRLHAGDNRLDSPKFQLGKNIDPNYRYVDENRYDLYGRQKARAALWNSVNSRIVLKSRLWSSTGIFLFFGLAIAIVIAEYLTIGRNVQIEGTVISYPFLFVAAFGAFGGTISAYRSVPEYIVEISSFQLLKLLTMLRMLLGAAGSFVVFIAIYWLGTDEIIQLLQKNMFAFIGMAITAGFSERLFLDALNRMAENLSINALPAHHKSKDSATEQMKAAPNLNPMPPPTSPREAFHKLTFDEKKAMILDLIKNNRDRWLTQFPKIKSIEPGHRISGSDQTKEDCITVIVAKEDISSVSGKIPAEISNGHYAVLIDIIEAH